MGRQQARRAFAPCQSLTFLLLLNYAMPTARKTAKKRTGRPLSRKYALTDRRHIPLDLEHGDVLKLDRAAVHAGVSRSEWCRRVLLTAVAA